MNQFKDCPVRKRLLKVSNYDFITSTFTSEIRYYKTTHQILADLEAKIEFEEELPSTILIPYKEDGDAIFDLLRVETAPYSNNQVAIYKFRTTIS